MTEITLSLNIFRMLTNKPLRSCVSPGLITGITVSHTVLNKKCVIYEKKKDEKNKHHSMK